MDGPFRHIGEALVHPSGHQALVPVELRAGQLGDQQLLDAFAQRRVGTAIASIRSDLPQSRPLRRCPFIRVASRTTRSPRPNKNRSRRRTLPAVLERPHPVGAEPASPAQDRGEAARADVDGLASSSSPVLPATAAIVCEL